MYPRRNSEIKSTLLPDGYMVLFNTKTDWVHTLNPSGALVWEFCDGRHQPDQIAAELAAATHAADIAVLRKEVDDLIGVLTGQGLLINCDSLASE